MRPSGQERLLHRFIHQVTVLVPAQQEALDPAQVFLAELSERRVQSGLIIVWNG